MFRYIATHWKKIPYAIAAALVFFLVAEVFTRLGLKIYVLKMYGTDIAALKEANLRADAEVGWQWPGQYTFRKRNAGKEKPPGLYRIITTGDSCCWGALVPDDYTYSAVLEKLLRARYGEGSVEVLNAGVVGYTTWQVTRQIETVLADYHPDLIIYYGIGTDADIDNRYASPDWKTTLFFQASRYSRGFLLLSHLLRRDSSRPPPEEDIRQGPLIDEMKGAAERSGAKLMLIEYLTYYGGLLGSELVGREAIFDVPVVRTLDFFINAGLPLNKLMFDQVHPTAAGHRIIAGRLFDEIVRPERIGISPPATFRLE